MDGVHKCLFFALPGNPVSCLVCKSLVVDPALKRLSGASVEASMPPQLQVTLEGHEMLKLDQDRPEYHRAIVSEIGGAVGKDGSHDARIIATSTGNQRSSRLVCR